MPTICRKEGVSTDPSGLYRRNDSIVVGNVDRIYEQFSGRPGTNYVFVVVATISQISKVRSPPGLVPVGTPINNRKYPPKKDATFGLAPKVR